MALTDDQVNALPPNAEYQDGHVLITDRFGNLKEAWWSDNQKAWYIWNDDTLRDRALKLAPRRGPKPPSSPTPSSSSQAGERFSQAVTNLERQLSQSSTTSQGTMALPGLTLTPQQLADITAMVVHIMQQNVPPPPPLLESDSKSHHC